MINIDFEKEKIEKDKIENKNLKEEEELEENMNQINIEEQNEEIENQDQKPEELNIDNYLFNDDNNPDNLKYNKEYTDNDDDLHSRRLTARNNDDYLINIEEKRRGKKQRCIRRK